MIWSSFYNGTVKDLRHRRGDHCVKSNIVNKECKDMVYTFHVRKECVWKSTGAKRREISKRGARLKGAKFCDAEVYRYVRQTPQLRNCDSTQ